MVLSLVGDTVGNYLFELIRAEQERALDVIEVRKGIESWTAYYAAKRATPDDLERMKEIVDGMESNLGSTKISLELDANLHIVIARATHKHRLAAPDAEICSRHEGVSAERLAGSLHHPGGLPDPFQRSQADL